MCGIAGFVLKRPDAKRALDTERLLDSLLQGIDHRGGDATGFVARNRDGEMSWHKASCDARKFIPNRRALPVGADVVLGHTRWATQGHQAFPENNHPIRRGAMYVIHNGVVTNDDAIFAALKRERFGQVDSEAIAAALSAAGSLDPAKCREALESIGGSAAIAALDERDGTLLLARISASPLYVLETRRLLLWASTAECLTKTHEEVIGSLGRAKVQSVIEGAGIIVQAGVVSDFEFTPKPTPPRVWTSYSDGSYLPSKKWDGNTSTIVHVDDDDDLEIDPDGFTFHRDGSVVYDGTTWNACEVCRAYCDDLYDTFDGYDRAWMCEDCWTSMSADAPNIVRGDRKGAGA